MTVVHGPGATYPHTWAESRERSLARLTALEESMKRLFAVGLLAIAALAVVTLLTPTSETLAGTCVTCSNRDVFCGHCYQFVPQDCQHCAYCKHISGCK